jgi:hypothetical protein
MVLWAGSDKIMKAAVNEIETVQRKKMILTGFWNSKL